MIGDQILIDLVQLLKSEFRQNDVIGRLGGDEFMVFMNQTQDPQAAIQKASHILNRLAVEKAGAFSVSIGIASAPLDGTTYDQPVSYTHLDVYKRQDFHRLVITHVGCTKKSRAFLSPASFLYFFPAVFVRSYIIFR